MTPDECRAEQVTIDELDAQCNGRDTVSLHAQMAVMLAKAAWEIAAQLSQLNEHAQDARKRLAPVLELIDAAVAEEKLK